MNLPAVSGSAGLYYTIIKSDSSANAVTIDGASAETINGATTFVLTQQYQSVVLRCDGAAWFTQPNSTERTGKATASGNGAQVDFTIAHGLGTVPSNAMISVAKPNLGFTFVTDATNYHGHVCQCARPSSNNVEIYWRVVT